MAANNATTATYKPAIASDRATMAIDRAAMTLNCRTMTSDIEATGIYRREIGIATLEMSPNSEAMALGLRALLVGDEVTSL